MPTKKRLAEGSLEKYNGVIERLFKADLTAKEALQLSDDELKTRLNFHGKQSSFVGLKANIRNVDTSLTKDNQRTKDIITYGISKLKNPVFRKAKRNIIIEVTGKNRFWFGVDEAKKLGYDNPIKATDTSIRRIKAFGYKRLNKRQKQIIDAISP